MKIKYYLLIFALVTSFLSACGTTPAETTVPPSTSPAVTESTVPSTTEPPAPDGFVCLNEMVEGSDITFTVEGSDIILDEDGLVLKMSIEKKEVFRDKYIVGLMKENPVIQGNRVYIHDQFFNYFFRKEGSEQVSLFYYIDFYSDEIISAVENPNASPFNTKLCAEVCLTQSMGITIPHIDMSRIFDKTLLASKGQYFSSKFRELGYNYYYYTDSDYNKHYYTVSEFDAIFEGLTLKQAGISDDETMTVGEYNRQKEASFSQENNKNTYPEGLLEFFKEKGIDPSDYHTVADRFYNDYASATDEELIEWIETNYLLDWESFFDPPETPEFVSYEPTPATPEQIEAMNAYFQGMDEQELKKWFFDFANEYTVTRLPRFTYSMGPSSDPNEYLFWVYIMTLENRPRSYKMYREEVDETVETYFGITLGEHSEPSDSWLYNSKAEVYYVNWVGEALQKYFSFNLLDSIEIDEGICTIHATNYTHSHEITHEQELQYKKDLLEGRNTMLYENFYMTLCFKLNPETMEPIFCGYVEEYPD